MNTLSIFAVAPPGLERTLADELASLDRPATIEHGGVAWEGTLDDVALANLELRTASRVLVRAGSFRARTFHELERRARRIGWDRFIAPGEMVRLRVTCRKSALYHQGAVAERILDAIEERSGRRGIAGAGDDDEGDDQDGQLFVVRMYRDVCTINADASGQLLYRRGYRQAVAKAPLRETIAAAMLRASGWTPDAPLLDPLCGSGTIPIEAALISRDIAPGLARADRTPRAFRFLAWPAADDRGWRQLIERATGRIRPKASAPILASDRNAGAIRAATSNAERAGVMTDIEFATRPLAEAAPPAGAGPGWIVTNPPYGERIGSRADARRIVAELDRRANEAFDRWSTAVLVPGRADRSAFETRNGGIPVSLRIAAYAAG